MAVDKKTSEETAAEPLVGDELVRVVQSAADFRTTTGEIAALSLISLLTLAEQNLFLDMLVTANVITAERKDEILPP